jgi:pilus assembly protein Flp/PilA
MSSLISKVRQFAISEDGPTAVEYAVMLGVITVGLVTMISAISSELSGTFSAASSTLS